MGKQADIVTIDGNPLEDIRRSEVVSHTMINGRLYEASSINQVAPREVERQPLFFGLEGGDAWIDSARQAHEMKARTLNWKHQ